MKHRFYGDKKDYLKYGLLEVLSSAHETIGVNWYLTDDHHGNPNHGNDTRYLDDENWKHYAPAIFASLRSRVKSNQRNVGFCRTDGVVEISHEFMDPLPTVTDQQDYSDLRSVWHTKARDVLTECDLVFLDPDIGVKDQLPSGPLRASEYSSYSEVCDYDWCDLLVVQFLQPRNRFQQLWTNPVTQHAMRQDKKVVAFIASSLAFLYVTNQVDITLLKQVFERWDTKISPQILIA